MEENPSSTGGVLAVMDHLHTFVPTNGDRVLPILCSGDGLSMERMISAHHNRTASATATGRLEGLKETPSEFHKEILLMQVGPAKQKKRVKMLQASLYSFI